MIRVSAVLAVAGIVAGCATPSPPVPTRSIPPESVRTAVDRLRSEAAGRTGVRGLASVRLDSPAGSGRIREVIIVQRPMRLRLETLSLLGQTQAVLVSNGERFGYAEGRHFLEGIAFAGVLRERFGLDLAPEEVVETLLAAPAIDPERILRASAVGETREVEGPRRRIRISGSGDLVSIEALDEGGGVRWVASYDRWREVAGGRYPFAVDLEFPSTGAKARMAMKRVELNPSLDPGLFRLPRGAAP